ncbi:MAG: hypothetical protein ACR2O4_04090 [Hyphomicrobiaceae bacterium]
MANASVVRIAMWSGPRNLSTAMMRSFGNRADTVAVDEPFYAAYLAATGIDHPMRDEILASQPTDPEAVVSSLLADLPGEATVHYQKHMTHHMVPAIPRGWMDGVRNAFLIRSPERVLASYAAKRSTVTLDDLGFAQQAELHDLVCEVTGERPPVIDTDDLLANPEGLLRPLCAALGLAFDPAMLSWPAGRWPCDGVWAAHWYGAVETSKGFGPASPRPEITDPAHLAIVEAARPAYDALAAHRLRPAPVAADTPA